MLLWVRGQERKDYSSNEDAVDLVAVAVLLLPRTRSITYCTLVRYSYAPRRMCWEALDAGYYSVTCQPESECASFKIWILHHFP